MEKRVTDMVAMKIGKFIPNVPTRNSIHQKRP